MYRNSDSIVRTAVGDTTPFPITIGVHQGSVLSPYLFSVILDELSASVQKLPQPWLLMYADDIALVDRDKGRLTRRVHAWREALENGGLKLNVAKTEYMACNSTDLTSLRIGDDTVERMDNFSLHVRDIADKLQESCLRWYGHVLRRPASYVGNKCLDMTLPGARSRGRPKKRWLDVVQDDMRANGLDVRDAEDRAKWRRKCRKADPGFSRAGRDEQPG
ncbi:unnamed protein product [Parnassius mnemosyne]|uniref:Reverse transcriptase domain-containing protein n=1 Tax=Parnassius mnemosyne TaxID=213953 RepID=A0AAV1LCY8_9NEOP